GHGRRPWSVVGTRAGIDRGIQVRGDGGIGRVHLGAARSHIPVDGWANALEREDGAPARTCHSTGKPRRARTHGGGTHARVHRTVSWPTSPTADSRGRSTGHGEQHS